MPKINIKSCSFRWENRNLEAAKKYWMSITGLPLVEFCTALNCIEKNISVVHVRKIDSEDLADYIVPLCHRHGALGKECEVYDYYLAPVFGDTNISDL